MAEASKKMITDIFVEGARKGWNAGAMSIIPNIMMAFILIKALNVTGALSVLGILFEPMMTLVGLPGEGAAVLMGALMSMGGGVGILVGLFSEGLLAGEHISILAPAIYLMGSPAQYVGRILGVVGTKGSLYPVMIAIGIINAFIAMFLMNLFV
ncbi:hypothetical protein GZ77_06405 [Endozoicomonas montiporae]|uniref:Nucleoside transporter/FeoB GTPase Gate domain-containing protein n=2 Tax=Endozoicomonas montiporae TaxID=1027273 RepID=A0A081NCB7_9GAMM|nr:YjiG family protein [Endozoicomonas montiporae]AMO56422.1 hypothetical protein EZMO1_2323 [Endozoicomonas montiporae CL-33]KEQ16090.1 hypothetical protein GZ77_06405 [Endozoicomonas montiporae]